MENLVILYGAELTTHAFEKVFDGKSAFEKVLEFAQKFGERVLVFTKKNSASEALVSKIISENPKIDSVSQENWTKSLFISQISENLKKNSAKNALVSFADTPFLNEKLTAELLSIHENYAAEYSFADGFPYGLTPEIIESGSSAILSELSRTTLKSEGEKTVDREAIFSLMRGDINSFEIETLIADEDYRLLRLNFECSSKINFLACKNLWCEAKAQKIDMSDAYALSNLAKASVSVLKTVPAFYNVQISSKYNHKYCYSLESVQKNPSSKAFMALDDFKKILSQIKDFSENAFVSVSAFGEPLLNPEFLAIAGEIISQNDENHKISLLVETDGLLVTEGLAEKISELSSQKNAEVNWIIYLDSVNKASYSKIHNCPEEDFEKALNSVSVLEKYFEGKVYPQFMRMKTNESELESFYRFWKEKDSPSKGELIIQKYNSFCKKLPELKSADLSPVNRIPCWHLRRDMTILSCGTVPVCFQLAHENAAGNIFSDGIEKIWAKLDESLKAHLENEDCKICDEFYTFNF